MSQSSGLGFSSICCVTGVNPCTCANAVATASHEMSESLLIMRLLLLNSPHQRISRPRGRLGCNYIALAPEAVRGGGPVCITHQMRYARIMRTTLDIDD